MLQFLICIHHVNKHIAFIVQHILEIAITFEMEVRVLKRVIKYVLGIGTLLILSGIFLIGAQSHYNQKEIKIASKICLENGGHPKIIRDYLALNYSFSCQKD